MYQETGAGVKTVSNRVENHELAKAENAQKNCNGFPKIKRTRREAARYILSALHPVFCSFSTSIAELSIFLLAIHIVSQF